MGKGAIPQSSREAVEGEIPDYCIPRFEAISYHWKSAKIASKSGHDEMKKAEQTGSPSRDGVGVDLAAGVCSSDRACEGGPDELVPRLRDFVEFDGT